MTILKKATMVLSSTLLALTVHANSISVPEIGSAGASGITIELEREYGNYYMAVAKGTVQSYDPVLNEYINSIGQKLVLHAANVKFPFEFYLSSDTTLNASAFLGGKVQINAGLFHYTKTEDEFASVLAHEISHVTQRHLARQFEDASSETSLTVGSIIAGAILALINADVGMAVMSAGTSISMQRSISYTRALEAEADRVGLSILYESGYNPMAMTELFRTLMKQQGDVNAVYAMLSDHPLSDERVSDVYNRAVKYPQRKNSSNPDFMFAKARIDVRYMNLDLDKLYKRLLDSTEVNRFYKYYALALISYEKKNYLECLRYLDNLSSFSKNDFIIDLKADAYIDMDNYSKVREIFEPLFKLKPKDSAVAMNLANLYIITGDYDKAVSVINKYLKSRPKDAFAYSLLSKAYDKNGNKCMAYQSLSWEKLLKADFKKATMYMTEAIRFCRGDEREIAQAKIIKISKQQEFYERLKMQ